MKNEYKLHSGDKLVAIELKDEDDIPEKTLLIRGYCGSQTIELKQDGKEIAFPVGCLRQVVKALNVVAKAAKENAR